jgi:hypothetical protein
MSFFPYTKLENKKVEQVLPGGGGLVPVGGERRWGDMVKKGECGVNNVNTCM